MKTLIRSVLLLLVTVGIGPVALAAGDAVRGKTLYNICSACHGANAEGTAALGHEAEVLAVETHWQWQRRGKHHKRQRTNVTKAFSFGSLGLQELAPGYLAGTWKRADVIHVHHPHSLADVVRSSPLWST